MATETFLLILLLNWGRFRSPFVCCREVAKVDALKGFFARAEKLVVPLRWKLSLWRSGWQQQKSPRKLLCWQPSCFLPGWKDFASLSEMNCAYYPASRGVVFWSLLHSAERVWHWCFRAISRAHQHLCYSVFSFAEHGSYTGFHVCLCSKPISRFINTLAGSDELDGPSLSESWRSSVPSPPAPGNRSNQPNLFLVMLFMVPSKNQGSCFFLLVSRICPPERNSPPMLPCDSQHCWRDATLGPPLCQSMFCGGPESGVGAQGVWLNSFIHFCRDLNQKDTCSVSNSKTLHKEDFIFQH